MKYASLNSSLLARKGEARPSTTMLRPIPRESISEPAPATANRTRPALTRPKNKSAESARIAKTVRLPQIQDTQLRLLAARHKLSVQDILEEAINSYLKREMDKQDCICKAG